MKNTSEVQARNQRLMHLFGLIVLVALMSGCATGFYDGMRVADRSASLALEGYIGEPGTAGGQVRVYARNFVTGATDLIVSTARQGSIANKPSYSLAGGTKLYKWNLGRRALPAAYWRSGTGGFYARVRAEWYDSEGDRVARLLNPRADGRDCLAESGASMDYLSANCFSHRTDAYIYTTNYRQTASTCANPSATLAKVHNHYMLDQVPACAQNYIYDRIAEKVGRDLIDDHYEIEHMSRTNAHQTGPVGEYRLGGLFGGHENYLRMMRRHVMVYDHPWMPRGEIPAWRSNTTVPGRFVNSRASRVANCNSRDPNCDGWLSGPVATATPNIPLPSALLPTRICSFQTSALLYDRVSTWHTNVHATLGASFRSMDSPAFPLFFAWHTYVEDVWLDWLACGRPVG